ncbi:hypothetical protein [Oleiharenicola lentus]|uniref:hypothetical protein n=1 Tax=Oleiharenicola lentus TaxID=2508720 RepID=UPI003F676D9B
MLKEYKHVRQPVGEGRRRWFEGKVLELIVWYGASEAVAGFQILYRTREGERALTWREGKGFFHSRVDNGTMAPMKNLTPILLPHESVPWDKLVVEFERAGAELEPELRSLVHARLVEQR